MITPFKPLLPIVKEDKIAEQWFHLFLLELTKAVDDSLHFSEDGEISGLTEKTTPVAGDVVVVEDSEDSYAKKKIQLANLPKPEFVHLQLTTQNLGGANGTVHYVDWGGVELHKDSIFTHSILTNPSRIEVSETGRYEVKGNVSITQGGAARTTFMSGLRVDGSTANLLGRQRNYSRGSAYGDSTTGINTEIELTAGEYIEMSITVDDADSAYTSNAIAAESELIIRKI